jgi:citrate lyase beta subunit
MGNSEQWNVLREELAAARQDVIHARRRACAEMPLRFWNQQAHFTTPASGAPEKAIRGLAPVPKLLDKFDVSIADVAEATGAAAKDLEDVLDAGPHSPFVMVDAEDAVALTPESIEKARAGAIRSFTQEDWGPTLPFFRPGGLLLDSCIDDLLTVFAKSAEGRGNCPIAGIVWPKSESSGELEWVCEALGRIERLLGIPENAIKLEFLVESGYALANLSALVRVALPRLTGIIWGIADYSADTHLPEIRNDHPLCDWARYEIVNLAGAAGVPAIDAMTLNYPTPVHRAADLTAGQRQENKAKILGALRQVYRDAEHGISLGMSGKWVGHPLQLWMVLAAYRNALPDAQIEQDLRDIEAYGQSVAAGAGATMLGDGATAYMADRATDRHVRERLRRAAAWGKLDASRARQLGIVGETDLAQLTGAAHEG